MPRNLEQSLGLDKQQSQRATEYELCIPYYPGVKVGITVKGRGQEQWERGSEESGVDMVVIKITWLKIAGHFTT